VTTKKKPYRKYDKAKHAALSEDVGASPIMSQPDRGTQNAFKAPASSAGPEELGQQLTELVATLAQYDKLKQSPSQQNDAPQQATAQQAPAPQGAEQAPAKPSLQFSSFLYQSVGNLMTEANWSNNNDTPQNSPVTTDNSAPSTDTQADTGTDLVTVKKAATQQIKQILDTLKQMGSDAKQQLDQLCSKHCGTQANRVITVLTQAAQKLGVQL
jgi:hypothetical protein